MILRSRGAKAPLLSVDLMPARVALNLRESGAVFPCKWCSVAEIYIMPIEKQMVVVWDLSKVLVLQIWELLVNHQ